MTSRLTPEREAEARAYLTPGIGRELLDEIDGLRVELAAAQRFATAAQRGETAERNRVNRALEELAQCKKAIAIHATEMTELAKEVAECEAQRDAFGQQVADAECQWHDAVVERDALLEAVVAVRNDVPTYRHGTLTPATRKIVEAAIAKVKHGERHA